MVVDIAEKPPNEASITKPAISSKPNSRSGSPFQVKFADRDEVKVFEQDNNVLHMACEMGDLESVKKFLRNGMAHSETGKDDRTPLHLAAAGKHYEVCHELLKFGAMADIQDFNGDTPLMLAAETGDDKLTGLMLTLHANVNVQNHGGSTALHYAAKLENEHEAVRVTKTLLNKGADPDIGDCMLETALHISARTNRLALVTLLVEANCDCMKKNRAGQRAADVAKNDAIRVVLGKHMKRKRSVFSRLSLKIGCGACGLERKPATYRSFLVEDLDD